MTADTVGGVWTYSLDLCRSLTARGIQVCLATMGAPLSADQQLEASMIPGLDVQERHYKLEWMDEPWEDVDLAGKWLLDLEQSVQPDLVHLNGYALAALNWHAPVLVVAHSCVLSWWKAVKGTPIPAVWDEYKRRVQEGFTKADAVVSISYAYAAELQTLYGPIDNLSVIYNGRPAGTFYSSGKKRQVFAMGRIWDEAKNISVLGQLSNAAQIPIRIAGNNRHPENGEVMQIPNVELLGTLSPAQVKEELAESLIYVLPAIYEPFGLSVLEAALSGCLLILSDLPVFRELWGDTALYFNPAEPKQLDELISKVLHEPENYTELALQAKKRAAAFSLEKMTDNYLNLYQSMVAARLAAPSTKQ
jgi:glycosyltransferase involved in cell wall biosynthesis